jgi:hypothetical protein
MTDFAETLDASATNNDEASKWSSKYNALVQQFQRDLNRISDVDRSVRKRGLQKLLEDLPWASKSGSQRTAIQEFINCQLIAKLIVSLSDAVEKCRELSIQLLTKCIDECKKLSDEHFSNLLGSLCHRIGDNPFPESSEEIRLKVTELLNFFFDKFSPTKAVIITKNAAILFASLSKALMDSFPAVKSSCADLLCKLCAIMPQDVRLYIKPLLKGLCTNVMHQHSKVRSMTLKVLAYSSFKYYRIIKCFQI